MPLQPDDTGSLEKARKRLYENVTATQQRSSLATSGDRTLPHAWEEKDLSEYSSHQGKRRVRLAGIFFATAVVFFVVALAVAGSLFYFGGNSVSVNKVALDVQGPTTIAGGDTVQLLITITNKNPIAIENAIIEIDFPKGTRNATNVLAGYSHYTENLGTLASGETVTRSVKAVLFGSMGQSLDLPVSFSYDAAGSNAVFVKKLPYALTISTTPLSVTVETLSETVSGKSLTLTLAVRSNATIPLNNVVVSGTFPFGFSVTSSSIPLNNSSFLIGTLLPGASKTITLTGVLSGQDKEQRTFHFAVGTADTPNNQTIAVTYMTQDVTVAITAPFIDTALSLNGDSRVDPIISSGSSQNVMVSYKNTLVTSVENAVVTIAFSGSAIDYNSIQSSNGFYNSADRTIVFSKDTDSSLAMLAPGATGIGTFTFSTLPASALAQGSTVNFTISVSGTRVGQSNVPEHITATVTKTAKVATTVLFAASALHTSGGQSNSGPIPPRANQATTYTILWNARIAGNTIAGGTASAVLPSYVTYTGLTTGSGSFSYDESSRTVSWNIGDITLGRIAQGGFQVSLTPSTSQKGSSPILVGAVSFSGYDRFAGVQIGVTADPVTTETRGDPGYISAFGTVQ